MTTNIICYFLAFSYIEIEASPVRCLVSEVKTTACGGDFTVWLSSVEGASILYGLFGSKAFCVFFRPLYLHFSIFLMIRLVYFTSDLRICVLVFRTAGLPQYGQLGHGTDNEVFCWKLCCVHSLTCSILFNR